MSTPENGSSRVGFVRVNPDAPYVVTLADSPGSPPQAMTAMTAEFARELGAALLGAAHSIDVLNGEEERQL